MSPLAIGMIAFACVFGGAILGMIAHKRLPDHHLDGDSKDVVKLVMGLIGTLAALVLGLLVASAKNTYDTQSGHVAQLSANILQIDRVLSHYGPEANETRESLRQSVREGIDRIWPTDGAKAANLKPAVGKGSADAFFDLIQDLSPETDIQRFAKAEAQQLVMSVGSTRLLMYAQLGGSIPMPFLVVLVSWLMLLYFGFGLLTKPNGTVVTALLIGSLSVAGAIFLVMELDAPYGGLMRISSAPLQGALAQISQ